MKNSSLISVAVVASAAALVLAGCSAPAEEGGEASTRACVILPDTASSPRWEAGDRPALEKAFTDAGFETDIQNAEGDPNKYASIADQMLTQGCGVMLLVDHQGAAVSVTENAKAQGIPVIAYDRPIEGADYYVSFDNEGVGALQGQMIVDGLAEAGKDPATAQVIYMGGDPADGNAKMFRDGAVGVMEAAGITPAQEPPGIWDGEVSATNFEQALTANGGVVDAVWAANDPNAAGVITVLDKFGLKVPVSGQDATVAGLQNVLLGKQFGTVWKPYTLEADAASELAIAILKGESPTVEKTLADGTPYVAVTPVLVRADNVQDVIDGGDASAADICTGEVEAVCAEKGIK